MNNNVYGKRMKNLRKSIKLILVSNDQAYKKYVCRPNFVSQKIFSKHFVAIHKIKLVLTLDKPVYI